MTDTAPLYDIRDGRFARLIHPHARLDRLWTGGRWCEGPAWFPAGKYAIWSDIPNDRVMRWDATDGSVSVFECPALNQNGHAVDREGRLIRCEHRGRAVTRIEPDGTRTVLADRYRGQRLNSPNDVTVHADGSVWFSDPTYGIDSDYEGVAAEGEIGAQNVYRIGPDGALEAVIEDLRQPNGLAFSPDGSVLYVSDTGITHDPACPPEIHAYPVLADGTGVGEGVPFCRCDTGVFDGFRLDRAGNLWSSAGDGVHCFAPDGTMLGRIAVPETVANLCFIGPARNRLLICATSSVYAIYVNATGL
ncbi:gluconolactonase [Rhodovulum sulfidophilum]|uniref:SMP-30/gluconolactonase/LRE family protein n=1 Tax=Rhodovulum visakhapatnamense TaxID=364297 RepID=A0ABS1RDL6_9RHOB|nr:SMP-30/gluconolactonase/LRE family protein [Rhodovulum visakhapatnamense]MBL3569303.1 SMP-30/gluconolactonase/LRE family protein [Rhodovulum visakhapatnamense]MBL3577274.1 SMP-30/gluconolactonase/LRE family protein [Rhodovulum visakhapatnamense]OLS45827.1 gluconolactonase [Rhodovulum sulfidophilum]